MLMLYVMSLQFSITGILITRNDRRIDLRTAYWIDLLHYLDCNVYQIFKYYNMVEYTIYIIITLNKCAMKFQMNIT